MVQGKTKFIALALAAAFGVAGCATDGRSDRAPEPTYESVAKSELIAANYRAADALLATLRARIDGKQLDPKQPFIVATIVNIDSLEQSSTLGRVVSEQISGRFSQSGLNMIEMKFRNNVYMKRNEGELLLTREIKEVAQNHNAQAVIVGTYGEGADAIYLNVKVIRPADNVVLAAHDYALPLNQSIRALVKKPR